MDNNSTIFPERLYKHRYCAGDAEYVHIEGDIYEDTTCSHYGGKCRIRVKKVDDHFEFVETANKIANEYVYFHRYAKGDTHYLTSKTRVSLLTNESTIESYRKEVESAKAELASAEKCLAVCTKPEKLNNQSLDGLDFGSTVYVVDENKKVCQQKVEYKRFSKNGIEDIETPAYYISRDKDNKKRLRAICKFNNGYDEEGYDETEYDAFTSLDDANNYLLDTSYEYFKKKVDEWKNKLAKVETSLANALARKADLERILKEEEANS
jgi:hypothetical protein